MICANYFFLSRLGGSESSADAEYLLTAYGLQFLDICKRCIMPIAVSGMRG